MPLAVSAVAAGTGYACPMVGPVDQVQHIKIDLSGLTTAEVDADGYLKPGVLFDDTALALLIATGKIAYGVVVEATKLPVVTPATNTTLAAETGDCLVAVCTHGIVNRDVAEDNLGRAYTAFEIAGFNVAGSHLRLTKT
jgi:hypothetical protein